MLQAFERLSLTSTQYYTQIHTNEFSEKLLQCPSFKRLDSVTITNFKSFRGKVYVGPLMDFTSIVGPNGAGKSNVLDALMFCFCNQKSKHNVFDLRDFLNREGLETYKEMTDKNKYCEVEAKFLLANDRYFTFTRTLYPDEQQIFLIDGEEYPEKVYQNFLVKNNINFITSNFAIWQGEIDKMLLKSPKELTNYIEIVSGSTFFKKQQEELAASIKKLEAEMNATSLRVAKLKQEKKQIKNFNHQKNSCLKIQTEYEQLLKQIILVKMNISLLDIKEFEKMIANTEKEEQKKIKDINDCKVVMQREQAQKLKLQTALNNLMKEIAENNTKLRSIGQLSNVIDVQTISEVTKEIDSLKKYEESLRYRRGEIERQMNLLPSTEENKEYLELFSKWQKENEAMTKQLSKRKEQYLYSESILQSRRSILEELNQKQVKMNQLAQEEQRQQKQIQDQTEQIEKIISKMDVQHAKLQQEFNKSLKTVESLQKKIIDANQAIIDLQTLMTESLENEKDKQIVLKLNSIEGFKGLVAQWLKPSNKKYEVCFQMLMGPVLKYLLCLDEASSKQVTIKLRQNYQIRNLIILSNVHEKKELVLRSDLGKMGFPAIDAIQFDKKLSNFQNFLKDFLNGKVICQDLGSAWKLLQKNVKGMREIYTLDGNVLRQDGVVSSYGSAQIAKSKYKYVDGAKSNSVLIQDLQSLQKQKAKYQQQLQKTKKKSNYELIAKHNNEIQKFQTKKEELTLKMKYLSQSIENKKNSKMPKGLEKEIQELEQRANILKKSVSQIENEMLKSKIFKDFLKKNNSLDNFRSVQDLSSLQQAIRIKNKMSKECQQTEREITKISMTISQKEEKLKKLTEKVNSIKGFAEKQDLEKTIKNQEGQLKQIREQLAKIKNINAQTLKFKSQLPQLNSKLEVMKERYQKMIKNQAENLGLTEIPSIADSHLLEQLIGIKIDRATKDKFEIAEQQLRKQKKELQKELQRNNVGLADIKSEFEIEESLDTEIIRQTEELKKSSDQKTELNNQLTEVKEHRKSIFMNFITQLKPILQEAYSILTQVQNGSGRVNIYMQNETFPCDEGLYYCPVPPTKRVIYDLQHLSGGEKSIAIIALQFAIAVTSKSPFLVLDETDAFLDLQNTKRFLRLIRKSLIDKRLQFIIITHKRNLFLSGESLVGVTKFKEDPFSKAFSLKLNESEEQVEVIQE